jgi:hypothetical protein
VPAWLRSRENAEQRFILLGGLSFLKVRFRGTGPFTCGAKAYLRRQSFRREKNFGPPGKVFGRSFRKSHWFYRESVI